MTIQIPYQEVTVSKTTAVILVNLGTPEEPTAKGVSRFLKKFLSDKRVVEAPALIWWFVLRLVVIPLRKKRVAHAYQSIWTDQGSPLRVISERQSQLLQEMLKQQQVDARVVTAETYGKISLADTVKELEHQGVERIVIIPMYPQYSGSTTGAIFDQLADLYKNSRNVPDLRVVKDFYDHPLYIEALANSVTRFWNQHGRNKMLLISFHGVPKSYVENGDPYYEQCQRTSALLANKLELDEQQWCMTFQSRFGPKEWLQPYTDETLKQLAQQPQASVDIVSPAFVADCLETLEELNVENRKFFLEAGGEKFGFIPCLNDEKIFIECLSHLIKSEI